MHRRCHVHTQRLRKAFAVCVTFKSPVGNVHTGIFQCDLRAHRDREWLCTASVLCAYAVLNEGEWTASVLCEHTTRVEPNAVRGHSWGASDRVQCRWRTRWTMNVCQPTVLPEDSVDNQRDIEYKVETKAEWTLSEMCEHRVGNCDMYA